MDNFDFEDNYYLLYLLNQDLIDLNLDIGDYYSDKYYLIYYFQDLKIDLNQDLIDYYLEIVLDYLNNYYHLNIYFEEYYILIDYFQDNFD